MSGWFAVFEGRHDPKTGDGLGGMFKGVRYLVGYSSQEAFEASLINNEDEVVYSGQSRESAHRIVERDQIEDRVLFALWQAESEPHLRQHYLSNQIYGAVQRGQVEIFLVVLQENWQWQWGDYWEMADHLRMVARIFANAW